MTENTQNDKASDGTKEVNETKEMGRRTLKEYMRLEATRGNDLRSKGSINNPEEEYFNNYVENKENSSSKGKEPVESVEFLKGKKGRER